MTKTCSKCNIEQPLTNFTTNRRNKDEKAGRCKTCISKYGKNWAAKAKKADPKKFKLAKRAADLKYLFGLLLPQYNAILKLQNYCCKSCNEPLDLTINNPVDHDHSCCKTKKTCGKCIRGIVHPYCNTLIAIMEGKKKLMLGAIEHAEKNEKIDVSLIAIDPEPPRVYT